MTRTDLVPMIGDRWQARVASDEWLRGETWGFVLAEVTGDIDRIREQGFLSTHDATSVVIVAIAHRDRDAGDENDARAY